MAVSLTDCTIYHAKLLSALAGTFQPTAILARQTAWLEQHMQPEAEFIYRKTIASLIRQRWVKD